MPTLLDRLRGVRALGGHFRLFFGDVDSGVRVDTPTFAEVEASLGAAEQLKGYDELNREIVSECNGLRIDLAAERDRSAKGVAAIAKLQAANEKLTADLGAACDAAKKLDDHRKATEATRDRSLILAEQNTDSWRTYANERGEKLAEMEVRALAAEARVKVLDGSAEPACFGIVNADNEVHDAWHSEAEARAHLARGWTTAPLYRHPPKPAGEPVAWRVVHSNGYTVFAKEQNAVAAYPGCAVTPLYEAPPVALGVEGERFACVVPDETGDFFRALDDSADQYIGTRVDAEEAAKIGKDCTVVRIVPADAKTVDLTLVRKALRMLHRYGGNAELEQAAADLRAAIGEKG